jgi:hypothetical protein
MSKLTRLLASRTSNSVDSIDKLANARGYDSFPYRIALLKEFARSPPKKRW